MTVTGIFDALWQWGWGLVTTGLGAVGSVVYRNRERSLQNQHRLEGDPQNPSDEGLMDIAFDTREKVDRLEARMHREHEEVMDKLETMDGDG